MGTVRFLARLWFRLRGWQYCGNQPTAAKYVTIGAPHTSNWDFVLFLAVASHFKMNARAIGKHTLVRGPFGGLMRRLGVIPVRRDTGQGVVEQMVAAFAEADRMTLVIAPEGTRSAEPHWRSGFYHIAVAAGVPIVMARINGRTKEATLSEEFMPTGNVTADMDRIRQFFAEGAGLDPAGESTIYLIEEAESGTTD